MNDALLALFAHSPDFLLEEESCLPKTKASIYTLDHAILGDRAKKEFLASYRDGGGGIYISANISGGGFPAVCVEYITGLLQGNPDETVNLRFYGAHSLRRELAAAAAPLARELTEPVRMESYMFTGNMPMPAILQGFSIRALTPDDAGLTDSFDDDDDYLAQLFPYSVAEPVYADCGVHGLFLGGRFIGYIGYYGLCGDWRDISFVYTAKDCRGKGCGKLLLEYFTAQNCLESKRSYYSYTDGEASGRLVKSCSYRPCAQRHEYMIL